MPSSSAEMCRFHITQPELLNQWKRSPLAALGRRSRWNACSFSISRTTPPWPCTIAFGRPGRAAAVDDPERMRRTAPARGATRAVGAERIVPAQHAAVPGAGVERERCAGRAGLFEIGHEDERLQARQLAEQRRDGRDADRRPCRRRPCRRRRSGPSARSGGSGRAPSRRPCPGAHRLQIAPIEAQARKPTTACGMFGR